MKFWGQIMRLALVVAGAFLALALQAGYDDFLVYYSTTGNDRYSDGSLVKDGECYALVYTRPGFTFAGFAADGRAASPESSDIAIMAPVAKGHRCPPTLFQVARAYADARTEGVWEVFLVDTRNAEGEPTGLDAQGRVQRVNGWRRVEGRVRGAKGGNSSMANFADLLQDTSAGRLESGASVLPPDAPLPRITDIKVVDGRVELQVADTVPYLTYDVSGAETPAKLKGRKRHLAKSAKDGRAGAPIKLEVPVDASDPAAPKFFKVIRK